MAVRFLRGLADRAAPVLLVCLLIGLALPDLAAFARPVLTPAVLGLLVLTMLRVDWDEVAAFVRRPVLVLGLCFMILVAAPVAVWVAASALGLPGGLTTALVLMAAAPPVMSSPAFSLLIGLDMPLSLTVMASATFLVPLSLPVVAGGILGIGLDISPWSLMLRLAGMVGGSLVTAYVLRRGIGRARLKMRKKEIDGLMLLFMVVFAVAVMDGVAARIGAEPATAALFFGASIAGYGFLHLAGTVACGFMGRREALTAGLSTANRNVALLLAILPAAGNADLFLFFALGQFPNFMLPMLMRGFYGKLMKDE